MSFVVCIHHLIEFDVEVLIEVDVEFAVRVGVEAFYQYAYRHLGYWVGGGRENFGVRDVENGFRIGVCSDVGVGVEVGVETLRVHFVSGNSWIVIWVFKMGYGYGLLSFIVHLCIVITIVGRVGVWVGVARGGGSMIRDGNSFGIIEVRVVSFGV
eukprot:669128-Amorphochlora_amoeboformis.AAC.1